MDCRRGGARARATSCAAAGGARTARWGVVRTAVASGDGGEVRSTRMVVSSHPPPSAAISHFRRGNARRSRAVAPTRGASSVRLRPVCVLACVCFRMGRGADLERVDREQDRADIRVDDPRLGARAQRVENRRLVQVWQRDQIARRRARGVVVALGLAARLYERGGGGGRRTFLFL